jgi:hypothetical protein
LCIPIAFFKKEVIPIIIASVGVYKGIIKPNLSSMWYGYTIAPSDPLFRAASHDSGIDGEIST